MDNIKQKISLIQHQIFQFVSTLDQKQNYIKNILFFNFHQSIKQIHHILNTSSDKFNHLKSLYQQLQLQFHNGIQFIKKSANNIIDTTANSNHIKNIKFDFQRSNLEKSLNMTNSENNGNEIYSLISKVNSSKQINQDSQINKSIREQDYNQIEKLNIIIQELVKIIGNGQTFRKQDIQKISEKELQNKKLIYTIQILNKRICCYTKNIKNLSVQVQELNKKNIEYTKIIEDKNNQLNKYEAQIKKINKKQTNIEYVEQNKIIISQGLSEYQKQRVTKSQQISSYNNRSQETKIVQMMHLIEKYKIEIHQLYLKYEKNISQQKYIISHLNNQLNQKNILIQNLKLKISSYKQKSGQISKIDLSNRNNNDQINKLIIQNKKLREQIKILTQDYSLKIEELNVIILNQQKDLNKFNSANSSFSKTQQEISNLTFKIDQQNFKIQSYEIQKIQLIKTHKQSISKYISSINQLKQTINKQYARQNELVSIHNSEINKMVQARSQQKNSMQLMIKQKDQEILKVNKCIIQLKQKYTILISTLEIEIESIKTKFYKDQAQYIQKINTFKYKVQILQKQKNNLSQNYQDYKIKSTNTLDDINEEIKKFRKVIDDLNNKINEQILEIADLNKKIKDQFYKLNNLEVKNEQLNKQIDQLKIRCEKSDEEFSKINDQNEKNKLTIGNYLLQFLIINHFIKPEYEKIKNDLNLQNKKLQEENKKVIKQLKQSYQKIYKFTAEIKKFKETNYQKKKKINSLEGQIKKLKIHFQTQIREMQSVFAEKFTTESNKFQQLKCTYEFSQQQIEQLKKSISIVTIQKQELRNKQQMENKQQIWVINQYKQKISNDTIIINSLNQTISKLNIIINNEKQTINELTTKLNQQNLKSEVRETQIKKILQEKDTQIKLLNHKINQNWEFTTQINNLKRTINNHENNLIKYSTQINQYKLIIETYKKTISSLNQKIQQINNQNHTLADKYQYQINSYRLIIDNSKTQIVKLNQLIIQQNTKINSINIQVYTKTEDYKFQISKLNQIINQQNEKIRKSTETINHLYQVQSQNISNLKKQLALNIQTGIQQKHTHIQQVNRLQKQVHQLTDTVFSLKKQNLQLISKSNSQIEGYRTNVNRFSNDIYNLNERLKLITIERSTQQNDINKYRKQLDESRESCKKNENTILDLNNKVAELSKTMEVLKNAINQYQKKIKEQQIKNEHLNELNVQINERLEELKKQYNLVHDQNEANKLTIGNYMLQFLVLNHFIKPEHEKIEEDLTIQNERLKHEVDKIENKYQELKNENKKLYDDKILQQKKVEMTIIQIRNVTTQYNNYKIDIQYKYNLVINSLNDKYEILKHNYDNLLIQLESRKQTISSLEEEKKSIITNHQNEIENQKSIIRDLKNIIQNDGKKVSNLNEMINKLDQKIKDQNDVIQKSNLTIKESNIRIITLEEQKHTFKMNIQSEIRILNTTIIDLNNTVNKLNYSIIQQKDNSNRYRLKITEMQDSINRQRQTIADQTKKIEQLEHQETKLISSYEESIKNYSEQLDKQKNQSSKLNLKVIKLTQKINLLSKLIKDQSQSLSQHMTKIEQQNKKIQQMQQWKKSIEHGHNQKNELKNEMNRLKQQKNQLILQNERLNLKMSQYQKIIEEKDAAMRNKTISMQNQIKSLNLTINQLTLQNQQYRQKDKVNMMKNNEIQSLYEQISIKQTLIITLNKKLKQIENNSKSKSQQEDCDIIQNLKANISELNISLIQVKYELSIKDKQLTNLIQNNNVKQENYNNLNQKYQKLINYSKQINLQNNKNKLIIAHYLLEFIIIRKYVNLDILDTGSDQIQFQILRQRLQSYQVQIQQLTQQFNSQYVRYQNWIEQLKLRIVMEQGTRKKIEMAKNKIESQILILKNKQIKWIQTEKKYKSTSEMYKIQINELKQCINLLKNQIEGLYKEKQFYIKNMKRIQQQKVSRNQSKTTQIRYTIKRSHTSSVLQSSNFSQKITKNQITQRIEN